MAILLRLACAGNKAILLPLIGLGAIGTTGTDLLGIVQGGGSGNGGGLNSGAGDPVGDIIDNY